MVFIPELKMKLGPFIIILVICERRPLIKLHKRQANSNQIIQPQEMFRVPVKIVMQIIISGVARHIFKRRQLSHPLPKNGGPGVLPSEFF